MDEFVGDCPMTQVLLFFRTRTSCLVKHYDQQAALREIFLSIEEIKKPEFLDAGEQSGRG